ncbi:cysteine proteinase [Tricholoma matsutake]|nr:cysteine proteinase [Tricholoma matsutake 945]
MAKSKWIFGPQNPQVHQDIPKLVTVPVISSADSKRIGLENFGNTCYANSVLQALYFCAPFRDLILQSPDLSISQSPSTSPPQSPPPAVPHPHPHPHPHPPPSFVSVRRKPERKPSISSSTSDIPPVIVHIAPIPKSPPTLFSALRSLFLHISTHPAERATVAPRVFIDKFREVNQDFRSTMHQDAHEFFNFLLNRIVEEIEEERKAVPGEPYRDDLSASLMTVASKTNTTSSGSNSNSGHLPRDATLVHKLFEGVLTSETRCLTCETVSSRDESFLDLSIDIEQNSSVTACLRQFSASEMLCQKNKFFCDACCDLQEAEKRMKIKKLPNVLALHLKRFKYQEDLQKSEIKLIKLSYRVAFPLELRIFNTVDDVGDADRLYNLFAIVVHIGTGPHHGHYVSLIKTLGSWLLFDDDNVSLISEHDIPRYFGDSSAGAAYVLYYQAADINLPALGLRDPTSTSATGSGSHSHPNNNSNAQPPYADPIIVPTLSSSNSTSTSTTVATSPEHIPVQPIPARPPPVLPPGLDEDSSDGEGLIDVMVKGSLDKDEDEGNRGEVRVNGYPVVDGWKPPLTTPAHTPTRSMTTLAQSGGGKAEKVEGTRPVSRGGLFETIRKTPSMSVKTGLAVFSHSHGAASGSSSALPVATHSNGTDSNVEGRRSMSPISPTSPTASGSGKWDGSEGKTSPTRQQRPMTAAGGGRTGRTHSSVPLVPLRRPRTAVGNLGGDEKRRSANLSSSVSGDEAGEKERG